MPANSAVCDRCRILLTADHVLREGATLCYRCAYWLLQADDLAAAGAPARPRPQGRRTRSGSSRCPSTAPFSPVPRSPPAASAATGRAAEAPADPRQPAALRLGALGPPRRPEARTLAERARPH